MAFLPFESVEEEVTAESFVVELCLLFIFFGFVAGWLCCLVRLVLWNVVLFILVVFLLPVRI